MRKVLFFAIALGAATVSYAKSYVIQVRNVRHQTVTGFGAACCDGAMCPYGTDTQPVKLLYGPGSKVGLNIMRMEISPNFKGDITAKDVGWDTPYDWQGSVPSAIEAKKRGALVFGTPWSPPGEYKTNGTAQGGHVNDKDDSDPNNQRGALRLDCYDKFFPWINTFLAYMKEKGVDVDAVTVQNEPDWWVNYSGCLYTPEQQVSLVKNYAHLLDRETYKGVRLISAEPLGFDVKYAKALMGDAEARDQIDILAGHLYGNPPLGGGAFNTPPHMKNTAALAAQYGKEVWMTEHSVTDDIDHLPTWDEQLVFAKELNECMLAGGTGYIYWYMRAHWAFVGTGETKYGSGNTKNSLLPRAYVMSHFSKHVTGSTRLDTRGSLVNETNSDVQGTAYIKGDSLIVMTINATSEDHKLTIMLPSYVKSGKHLVSTGNEKSKRCQEQEIEIDESVNQLTASMPAKSVNTYIFMIDTESVGIESLQLTDDESEKTYYDLQGRRMLTPRGLCIEKTADGFAKKVYIRD